MNGKDLTKLYLDQNVSNLKTMSSIENGKLK